MALSSFEQQFALAFVPSMAEALPTTGTPGKFSFYSARITKDPTGTNPFMIIIELLPGKNGGDPDRLLSLPFLLGMDYAALFPQATFAFREADVPDTMRALNRDWHTVFTEDARISDLQRRALVFDVGAKNFYHPPNKALSYPRFMGCGFNDDKIQNLKSRRIPSPERLRSILRSRWLRAGIGAGLLAGAAFFIGNAIVGVVNSVGRLIGSCEFKIISSKEITCDDGSKGELILYQAPNCSIRTFNTCTGEGGEETPPPAGPQNLLILAGIGAVALLALGTIAYAATRPRREEPSTPQDLGAPRAPASTAPLPTSEGTTLGAPNVREEGA